MRHPAGHATRASVHVPEFLPELCACAYGVYSKNPVVRHTVYAPSLFKHLYRSGIGFAGGEEILRGRGTICTGFPITGTGRDVPRGDNPREIPAGTGKFTVTQHI